MADRFVRFSVLCAFLSVFTAATMVLVVTTHLHAHVGSILVLDGKMQGAAKE